ncbi:MAG: putative LysR family transcriptional regulator [Actinomycetia bacterium]|nr:putative LysR family transcriptional regulator [Actinomycetes bacterium]
MAMDLRQLAALVAVAETGTFSAAADALHTVQSNVSTHVARLERELGATLVDRAAGRLTEEGELVVARARRVQAELEALTADVASLRDEVAGATRLGVIGTTARWLVPVLLSAMEERHPKVKVTVLEGNTTSLLPQLAAGGVDLGVVNYPTTDPEVLVEPLFDEDFILVAPSGHPLAEATKVTLADLAEHELIMPPSGASIRVDLDRAAAAAGVTLRPKAELDGIRLIASMAFEGYGAAVLPSTAVPRWLTGEFRILPVEGIARRRVGIGRRRRGLPSAPTKALADVLRDVVRDVADQKNGLHPSEA